MTFQEANDFQIDFLAECLPDYDFIGQRHPAPPFWQNNVIFYRAPWKLDNGNISISVPPPISPAAFRPAAGHDSAPWAASPPARMNWSVVRRTWILKKRFR
jgi:hypothetical protein